MFFSSVKYTLISVSAKMGIRNARYHYWLLFALKVSIGYRPVHQYN